MNNCRRSRRTSPVPILALLAIVALAAGAPLAAQVSADSRWTLRLYGLGLYPDGQEVQNDSPQGPAIFSVSDGTGFGLDLEYMLTEKVGLEAALMVGDYEADFRLDTGMGELTDIQDLGSEIVTLGANYHFTPRPRTDLFVGVMIAMGMFDGVTFLADQGVPAKRPFDDDVGGGLKAGAAFSFGSDKRWNVNVQIRYLVLILEAESASGGRDANLNPFIPSVGIGYRF